MAGDPKFPDAQTLPPFSYAEHARMVGLDGIVMRTPDDIARGWDEAILKGDPERWHVIKESAKQMWAGVIA